MVKRTGRCDSSASKCTSSHTPFCYSKFNHSKTELSRTHHLNIVDRTVSWLKQTHFDFVLFSNKSLGKLVQSTAWQNSKEMVDVQLSPTWLCLSLSHINVRFWKFRAWKCYWNHTSLWVVTAASFGSKVCYKNGMNLKKHQKLFRVIEN